MEYEIIITADSERGETWYNGKVWALTNERDRIGVPAYTGSLDTKSEVRAAAQKLCRHHAERGVWRPADIVIRGEFFTVES